MGERPPSEDLIFGWWFAGQGQDYTGSGDVVLGTNEHNVTYPYSQCPYGPYQFGPGSVNNNCDQFHFWSLHAGGGNFLLAEDQLSDKIASFRIDQKTGALTPTGDSAEVPSPVCLVFLPLD